VKLLLEVVVVPVSDVDRAKEFYAERAGFHLDFDNLYGGMRVVQFTPPGSGCSIAIGTGISEMEPGSLKNVQLVTPDVRAARAALAERGVDISEVQVYAPDGLRAAHEDDELDNVGFAFFSDPDGNKWAVQQIGGRRAWTQAPA
jgi:catechol 2,3-dioxygenase-like lactoylglutathione lyase family enzyme